VSKLRVVKFKHFNINLLFSFTILAGLFIHLNVSASSVDPTRPFGHTKGSSALVNGNKLVLESIIHGDGIHTVVINSKVLKVGDSIVGYRLVAVNDDSVVLRSETERLKLYVFKAKVLKKHGS